MKKTIKFVDLFAGIGGFHKALEIASKKVNYDINCVFVSEIDKNAIKTYLNNFSFKKEKILNIRDVDEESSQVPDHDFLFAGFPCQTFSSAGNKKGFLDEIRGTLFFDIARILKNKKPKYILLENVKHLVNHDNGKTWKIIIKKLEKLDYLIPDKPLILSPHEFGIPQDRKRVFIPGVLKSKINKNSSGNINIDFSDMKSDVLSSDKTKKIRKYIKTNFLEKNIENKYFLNPTNEKDLYLINVFEAWNVFLKNVKISKERTMPVIWTWELKRKYKLENLPSWKKDYISKMRKIYRENKDFIDSWIKKYKVNSWKKREQKLEWQAGKDINDIRESFIQLRQSGIRCKRPTKFPTLVAMVQIPIIFDVDKNKWRHLTPREVANLQSFPKKFKTYNETDSSRNDFYSYKQFGNAVNVHVTSMIQEYLLKNF